MSLTRHEILTKDLVDSEHLELYPVAEGIHLVADVMVFDGSYALGQLLYESGILTDNAIIIRTDSGKLYLLSFKDMPGNTVEIYLEYIDPELSEGDTDILNGLKEEAKIAYGFSIRNNPLFWWGTPSHRKYFHEKVLILNPKLLGIWNNPAHVTDDVLYHAFKCTHYTATSSLVEINGEQHFFKHVDVISDDAKTSIIDYIKQGREDHPDPDINCLQLGEEIWVLWDEAHDSIAVDFSANLSTRNRNFKAKVKAHAK